MIAVCIPAVVLNQERLQDFRVMRIDDSAFGLLEVTNEELKHPDLHFKPLLFLILLHHLEEGGSNLSFPWQNAAIFFALAKCSDAAGDAPAFVL